MFTITRKQFKDATMNAALGKVLRHTKFQDVKFTSQLGKLVKIVDDIHQDLQEKYIGELKKFTKLDASGNLAPFEGKEGTYELLEEIKADPERQKAFKTHMDAFELELVEINHPKIPLTRLSACELSPVELNALEPFLIDMEPVSKGNVQNIGKKKK